MWCGACVVLKAFLTPRVYDRVRDKKENAEQREGDIPRIEILRFHHQTRSYNYIYIYKYMLPTNAGKKNFTDIRILYV